MSRIKLTSVGWNVNWTDVSRADNPSESRDNPSRRHNALARWVGLLGRRSCVCVVFESFVLWILTDWAFSSSLKVSVTVMWVGQKCWHRSLLQEMTEWRAQNGSTSTFENSCCGYTALGTLEFPPPPPTLCLSLQQHPSSHTKNISNDNIDLGYYWKKNSCIHVRARMTPEVTHTHTHARARAHTHTRTHTRRAREMRKLDTCFSWVQVL